jgi:hypothetical protein
VARVVKSWKAGSEGEMSGCRTAGAAIVLEIRKISGMDEKRSIVGDVSFVVLG